MTPLNVHEATREQLDRLVAMAEKLEGFMVYDGKKPVAYYIYTDPADTKRRDDLRRSERWNPSTNGAQCMELIEEYGITIEREPDTPWYAYTYDGKDDDNGDYVPSGEAIGDTAKIAACRAYVISKLGETVSLDTVSERSEREVEL